MLGVSIQIYATADIEATKCKYDWIGVCNNRPIDFHWQLETTGQQLQSRAMEGNSGP